MEQPTAVLLAGTIAGVVALTGLIVTNVVAIRNESRRHYEARKLTDLVERRSRSAAVFKELLSALHAVEWLASHAQVDARSITAKMIDDYNAEIHQAFAALMGSTASLAAVDVDAYESLQPELKKLYNLEWRLAQLVIRIRLNAWMELKDVEELKSIASQATKLGDTIPTKLSTAMRAMESRWQLA